MMSELLGLEFTGLKSNFVRLSRPYKLNFAVTYWCQSHCVHCNIWATKPKGELTTDEIREFAKKNTYFKWIELTGGEPFLRSDIVDVVKAFKEHSKGLYIVTMPTNSLCDQDMVIRRIREMLEMGIPRIAITVSLDGHRELHDRIRGVPGNYDRAINMFKRLRELRKEHGNLFFVFGYTMISHNQGQLLRTYEEVKKDIPDIKYNDFHINIGHTSENYYRNQASAVRADTSVFAEEIEEFIRHREPSLEVMQIIERAFLKKLVVYARTGRQPMKCRSLETSLFIDSWGGVYPSIMWNKKIANLREIGYDLDRVWRSREAEEIRKEIRENREPNQWTSCEAYQVIIGNIPSFITAGIL